MPVDMIGQELAVNEVVAYDGNVWLVTKINAKTVRLDNTTNDVRFSDVVIVTQNMIACGRQNHVDQLRHELAAHIVTEPAKEFKAPTRYVFAKGHEDEPNAKHFLIAVEVPNLTEARDNMQAIRDKHSDVLRGNIFEYLLRFSRTKKTWVNAWELRKDSLYTLRDLPEGYAALAKFAEPYVEIPPELYIKGDKL